VRKNRRSAKKLGRSNPDRLSRLRFAGFHEVFDVRQAGPSPRRT
jgi:hypothetical protein